MSYCSEGACGWDEKYGMCIARPCRGQGSLTFSVYDNKGGQMFSGPLFVRGCNGPPVSLEEIVNLCRQADANHLLMPALRLDLQRAMLLADTATIQAIAGCIVGGLDANPADL